MVPVARFQLLIFSPGGKVDVRIESALSNFRKAIAICGVFGAGAFVRLRDSR